MGRWKAWEKVADGLYQGTPDLEPNMELGMTGYLGRIKDMTGNIIRYSETVINGKTITNIENLGGAGIIADIGFYNTGTDGHLYGLGWGSEQNSWQPTGWEQMEGSPKFIGPVVGYLTVPAGFGEALGQGSDHQLLYTRLHHSSSWKWHDLGKPGEAGGKKGMNGPPAMMSDDGSLLHVLARGQDNHLWHISITQDFEAESDKPVTVGKWTNLGGGLSQPPVAHSDRKGIEAFVVGEKSEVWSRRSKGRGWGPWEKVGGEIKGMPAVTSDPESGDTFLFARGSDDQLWYRRRVDGKWTRWQAVGDRLSGSPALWWEPSWGEDRPATLSAMVLRNGGELWRRTYRFSGSG